MKEEFAKAVAQVRSEPDEYYPFVILVEGDKTKEDHIGNVMEDALNPIMSTMPCPLPGVPQEKRDLRFGLGPMNLTPEFSYYHFTDQEMFELTEKKMTGKGFNIQTLKP